ncbi:hypothetical protein SRABI64_01916 [Pseudomonas carnis]|nr:hypothetical protein SRABI08_00406 [Pseudomonas carnis]CAH0208421.1 hypothetical protein SRABI64_01916 [Pseudomonas carnis]CAH0325092.1 hypothetical protein SRABI110_06078 [Pseudomonas carnis]
MINGQVPTCAIALPTKLSRSNTFVALLASLSLMTVLASSDCGIGLTVTVKIADVTETPARVTT